MHNERRQPHADVTFYFASLSAGALGESTSSGPCTTGLYWCRRSSDRFFPRCISQNLPPPISTGWSSAYMNLVWPSMSFYNLHTLVTAQHPKNFTNSPFSVDYFSAVLWNKYGVIFAIPTGVNQINMRFIICPSQICYPRPICALFPVAISYPPILVLNKFRKIVHAAAQSSTKAFNAFYRDVLIIFQTSNNICTDSSFSSGLCIRNFPINQ